MDNILVTFLVLTTVAVCQAMSDNTRSCSGNFVKVGCFKRNEKLLSKFLITDLDPTHAKWGKHIDWSDYKGSLRSIACRCWQKAHKEYKFFAIGFYGECWAGDDKVALDDLIMSPDAHASTSCVNGNHETCDWKSKHECAGTADNEYIYEITPNQPPPLMHQSHHAHIHAAPGRRPKPTTTTTTTTTTTRMTKPKPTKPPQPADCVEQNVSYQGYSFRRFNYIPSARLCAFHCMSVFHCKAWVWIPHRRYCMLKRSVYRKVTKKSYVAGKRSCGLSSCKEDNINYVGHTYATFCRTHHWWRCSWDCRHKRQCRAWTWDPRRKCCEMKRSGAGRRKQAGLISGTNVCRKI